MIRHDYTFPFRIDGASHQAAQSRYKAHVEQMIRQVLLTSPGERVNLPEFGCGLRQLVFAPHSSALDATTKLVILQALNRWLSGQIEVKAVKVASLEETGDPAQLSVQIDYVLVETMANKRMEVRIL
jgi:phage baseplate assembly protein W